MKVKQCKNGHYYDSDQYAECPHCIEGKGQENHCLNCGNPLKENAKFCPKCGTNVAQEKRPIVEPVTKKKTSIKWLIVILLILIILGTSVFAFFMLKDKIGKSNKSGGNVVKVEEKKSSKSESGTNDTGKKVKVIEKSEKENIESEKESTKKVEAPKEQSKEQQKVESPKKIVHSYELVSANRTWAEAEAEAKAKGGYLAAITSAEEEATIKQMVSQQEAIKVYWLGGNDLVSKGQYTWITGEAFSYSDWHTGEPNNEDGTERYLSIYNMNGTWAWNDIPIDIYGYFPNKIGYIVEYEKAQ